MDRCMRSRGRGRWTSGMISTTTASGNANGCLRMSRSQETVTRRNGPQSGEVNMTRTEFVRAYAARSGLDDEWAVLGFIKVGESTKIAMPCACGEEGCEGWAMIGAEHISHHLAFNAPDKLRLAYREAIG